MNVKDTVKYLRAELTKNGMTLKIHKRLKINGSAAYYVDIRQSGETLIENLTIGSLLNNYESGYINALKESK